MSSTAAQLFNSSSALGPLDPSSSGSAIDPSIQSGGMSNRNQTHGHETADKSSASPSRRAGTQENADYPPYAQMLVERREARSHPQLLPQVNGLSIDQNISRPSRDNNGSRSASSERYAHTTQEEPARDTAYHPSEPTNGNAYSKQPEYHNHTRDSTDATAKSKYGRSSTGQQIFGTPQVGIIGRLKPREMIRLDRDYSAGEICQFWSGYPFELEGRITATQHLNVLNELNDILASAFNPYKSIVDNVIAVFSLYISTWLVSSHYDKEIARFDRALDAANQTVYNPAGLHLLNPRKNAFLFLELEYY